jgi:hypothetical protein
MEEEYKQCYTVQVKIVRDADEDI